MAVDFRDFKISADDVKKKLQEINATPVSQSVVDLGNDLQSTVDWLVKTQAYFVKMGGDGEAAVSAVGQEIQGLKVEVEGFNNAEPIDKKLLAELNSLIDEFTKTGRGAEALKSKLQEIEQAHPDFTIIRSSFDDLITKMLVVIKTAQDAGAALSMAYPKGPDEAKATASINDPFIIQRQKENAVAADFEKNATRRAGLTKTQLDLETKLADVRKRLQGEGVTSPDEDMVRRIAEAELAGEKARSSEGKKPKREKAHQKTTDQQIGDDIQAVRDRTAALQAEAQMVGLSYEETEKRRVALDLEQQALAKLRDEAIKKGQTDLSNIKLSPEQRAQIDEVSAAYGRQAEALRQVQDQQQKSEQAASEFYDTFKSSMIGAITGADSLSDALSNILEKLADMLLNSAFDALFKPATGGSGGGAFGSIFSAIGGLLGMKDGGRIPGYDSGGRITGPGGPRDDKVLMWGSNGEFIMNAAATQKFLPILEAMNQGEMPAFRDGGAINVPTPSVSGASIPVPSVPTASDIGGSMSTTSVTFSPVIDARGADSAAVARLAQELDRQRREFSTNVLATMTRAKQNRVWKG